MNKIRTLFKTPATLDGEITPAYKWLMGITVVVLIGQAFTEANNNGDYIGYLTAGQNALSGTNIYLDYKNTWPPFFSIFSVLFAWGELVSPYITRLFWLFINLASFYVTLRIFTFLFLRRKLLAPFQKKTTNQELSFHHPLIIVPTLLVLRLLIEHTSNLQINLLMMCMAAASIFYFYKGRPEWAGLILGLSIGLKVFTVLFLFYFIYKRAWGVVLFTVFTIAITIASTALVFGITESIQYHHLWWIKNSIPLKPAAHMNQGLLAMFLRFFTDEDTKMPEKINVAFYTFDAVKRMYYATVLLVAILPAWLFRQKLEQSNKTLAVAIQWAVLFAIVPILSPVGWKYYYVFMWFPYFIIYYTVFYKKVLANLGAERWCKLLFFISLFGLTFSSELFLGPKLSDILELFSIVTIGGLAIVVLLLLLFLKTPKQALTEELA